MHHQVKRMLVMVALFSHRSHLAAQAFEREKAASSRPLDASFYRSNCHPSSAISQPASRTWAYSGPASFSMGFVLLI